MIDRKDYGYFSPWEEHLQPSQRKQHEEQHQSSQEQAEPTTCRTEIRERLSGPAPEPYRKGYCEKEEQRVSQANHAGWSILRLIQCVSG